MLLAWFRDGVKNVFVKHRKGLVKKFIELFFLRLYFSRVI